MSFLHRFPPRKIARVGERHSRGDGAWWRFNFMFSGATQLLRRRRWCDGQSHQKRFHHYDGGIDDNAEINGPQRNEIRRNPAPRHQDECNQQRERNDQPDHQSTAPITQKNHEDEQHQRCANGQIFLDRVHGVLHQCRAVIVRHHANVWRQQRSVDVTNFRTKTIQHFQRVLAFSHQHDALHHIVGSVFRNNTLAGSTADVHRADVAYANGRAFVRRDRNVFNVAGRGEETDTTHDLSFKSVREVPAAGIEIRIGNRLLNLRQRNFVRLQSSRIDIHLILFDLPAKRYDVGNAAHGAYRGLNHPVLNGFEFCQRTRALHGITKNFARAVRERRQTRLDGRRHGDVLQPLQRLLSREVIGRAVFECERHHGQTEH